MIKSMTGMGRARGKMGSGYLQVDIKSVNHKFCEVHTRLPSRFQVFEIPLTQMIKKKIGRGKIDVSFFEEKSESTVAFNKTSLKSYYKFLQSVRKELKLKEEVSLAHILSGSAFWFNRDNEGEKLWPVIAKIVEKALADMSSMRDKEGRTLATQILQKIDKLEGLRQHMLSRREEVLNAHTDKLKKRIEKILTDVEVDQTKLANELAFFADRSDITEELDRLVSHFSQVRGLLKSNKPCGRPLDFLIQEMNREWNTIGSKSQDISMTHWVVEAKSELEKIREQVQNIE